MDSDRLGHLLDMLAHCNAYGPVTVSGMGPTSAEVSVTVANGRGSRTSRGVTLTVALERMVARLDSLSRD
jgi:hypothetical protein